MNTARTLTKLSLLKRASPIDNLDLLEAVLDAFADLVWESDSEEYVQLYGIARDALAEAKKERQFSYESREAPHQYYYPEDLRPQPKASPKRTELQVPQMDITMRPSTQ